MEVLLHLREENQRDSPVAWPVKSGFTLINYWVFTKRINKDLTNEFVFGYECGFLQRMSNLNSQDCQVTVGCSYLGTDTTW